LLLLLAILSASAAGGAQTNKTHWAYVKPSRPALPEIKNRSWPRNPIDRFILARLEKEGMQPSPPADRALLIRRVSLDLTGLPPALEEVAAFLDDSSPLAYEKVVDHCLAKPAFGEHWARLWLDLARYADSCGYADDPPRTNWLYRDYVIKALNANKPFDRFTIEQIAGDLLPDCDEETQTATSFHRNTMTNNEGGTDDEEFRNVAVVDRVNTTMSVWMGTSMGCAQCHDHKYDPFSQREYFRLFAIFNNTEDADRRDDAPVLKVFKPGEAELHTKLEAQIAALTTKIGTNHLADTNAPEGKVERERLTGARKEMEKIQPTPVLVMRELQGDKRRKTHIHLRGNFQALGDEVTEGVPAIFHPLPQGVTTDRLALAKWLMDENNPLTARVVANRFWEQIFGTGIVRTVEDFGSRGDLPTDPQLLDWLATELVAQKWDIKAFLKLLVTSAAYCQSSRVTPELEERDPDNVLLARGPRFRLPAEVVRDQALFVGGILSSKMYGAPVRPPRPSFGLSAAFGSSLDWKNSEGEDRYRRALYIEWRRTALYPSLAAFDAPNREVCALRRSRSNTPLQALATLNDPVQVEAAQGLARRIGRIPGSAEEKARYGFRLCLARNPREEEVRRLTDFYQSALAHYASEPEKAKQMATEPLGPLPTGSDVGELAAWTAAGNVLLNLDEMLMKP
jgi:hypothetical protein